MNLSTFLCISAALLALPSVGATAHDGKQPERCPYCRLPVKEDGSTIDNRVTLTRAGRTAAYRCILCALADAKGMTGDLAISAASDVKGQPVVLKRTNNEWAISPPDAVFAYAQGSHFQCQIRYRAMRSKEALASYAKANPNMAFSPKPLTLKDMLKVAE